MIWIDNLKLIMKREGVNRLELQKRIREAGGNLSRNAIGNILNGKHSPRIDSVKLITDALGVNLWDVFTPPPDEALTGFFEYRGQIYRVKSLSELEDLVYKFKTQK